MKSNLNNSVDIKDYQSLINQLNDFIELRFGVYLDSIMGFTHNLEDLKKIQQHILQLHKISIENLDKTPFT